MAEQDKQAEAPGGAERPPKSGAPSESQRRAFEQLQKQISRMAGAKDQARAHEKNAEKLMREAQKLYDSASPEQREQMRQWARQFGDHAQPPQQPDPDETLDRGPGRLGDRGRGGSPFGESRVANTGKPGNQASGSIRTEPVDARQPRSGPPDDADAGDQVVAEWLGKGQRRTSDGGGSPSEAVVQERLRAAARSAEQAIGDRAVPGKYDRILREYFNRLPGKFAPGAPTASGGAAGGDSSAGVPAADAPPPPSVSPPAPSPGSKP